MSGLVLDLFAGPGGWDVAAQRIGLGPLGVETDDAACATREAAGLQTWQGSVTDYLGGTYLPSVAGLIASPPCQTFSMAGKGAGRAALDQVLLGVKRVAAGEPIPYEKYADIRTGLVLEPLRYALELEPEWIAWEQVPTVQPVWDACAEVLREDGYSAWTGLLYAEQYGVPQTRKRAVLIASRVRTIDGPPVPTHSRYYPRNPAKLDDGVQKWVSMAEALGWGMTERPSMTVTGGGSATGGAEPFGNAARQGILREQSSGRWGAKPLGSGSGAAKAMLKESREGRWLEPWRTGDDPAARPSWTDERPSTTIVGSFRPEVVAAPGYRTTVSRQNAAGSVRVTVAEAAVLQSFPPDHPWQGSKTKQYQQVGNAIPPLLAEAVLRHVLGFHPSTNGSST